MCSKYTVFCTNGFVVVVVRWYIHKREVYEDTAPGQRSTVRGFFLPPIGAGVWLSLRLVLAGGDRSRRLTYFTSNFWTLSSSESMNKNAKPLDVQEWETAFQRVHCRKPNKADIAASAPNSIKSYYNETLKSNLKRKPLFRLRREEFAFELKKKPKNSNDNESTNTRATDTCTYRNANFDNNEDYHESNRLSKENSLLEQIRCDQKNRFYKVEPLAGITNVKVALTRTKSFPTGLETVVDDGRSLNLSPKVDLSKRTNMCKFISSNDNFGFENDLDGDNNLSSSSNGQCSPTNITQDLNNLDVESADQNYLTTTYSESGKGLSKRQKANGNFLKLNMKKRQFAPISKIVKKLKGSALKKHLFRIRKAKSQRMS